MKAAINYWACSRISKIFYWMKYKPVCMAPTSAAGKGKSELVKTYFGIIQQIFRTESGINVQG